MSTNTIELGRDVRVRIVTAYPEYSLEMREALPGMTGTCLWDQPDSAGDIRLLLDEGQHHDAVNVREVYARDWEVIQPEALDLPERERRTPEEQEVARLQREVERLQGRETDLIDAMYEEAKRRQWGGALKHVLDAVGLEARAVPVNVVMDVKRSVYLNSSHLTEHAQSHFHVDGESIIHGQTTWTQRVHATLPDVTECDHPDRYSLSTNEDHRTVLRQAVADHFRVSLTSISWDDITVIQTKCTYCEV